MDIGTWAWAWAYIVYIVGDKLASFVLLQLNLLILFWYEYQGSLLNTFIH